MRKRQRFFGIASPLGLLIGCGVLTACGPAPKPIVTTIQVPSFRVHDEPEQTKQGLTVSIRPITDDVVRSIPQIYKTVLYKAVRPRKNLFGIPDSTLPPEEVQVRAELSIIPLPAFQVRIANHTGHALRCTQAVFRLDDGVGRHYPLFASTAELVAWLENIWTTAIKDGTGPEVAQQVMPGLKAAVNALPLLNRNVDLLNGDEWSGYLSFNMNVTTEQDYHNFMTNTERLTLRLAEMPVGMSDAGQVTNTAEFTFVVDKVTAPLAVKCPPGTQNPSLSVCSKEM